MRILVPVLQVFAFAAGSRSQFCSGNLVVSRTVLSSRNCGQCRCVLLIFGCVIKLELVLLLNCQIQSLSFSSISPCFHSGFLVLHTR
jgi:hypothetical protein